MTKTISPLYPYSLQFLRAFFNAAIGQQLPIAAWKLPGSSHKNLIVDLSGKAERVTVDLEELDSGFVVSPFNNPEQEALFINADLHYQCQREEIRQNPELTPEKKRIAQQLMEQVDSLLYSEREQATSYFVGEFTETDTQQADYENIVRQGVKAIKRGEFQKVVLSRNKIVPLAPGFDLAGVFDHLCRLYPAAFVSLISIPGIGTWIGASPEILISVDKNKIFRTVALAGTQPKGDLEDLNEAMWKQKEIEEQAMVSRYIISCFKRIRLREYEEMGPRTVVAANLMHLKTDFEVDMEATKFPQIGTVMLNLLHPTSAVCGMPKEPATNFILQHENYNRSLYSGYLGPVNMEEETHIFVNLRCMQLLKDRAVLYAGAGITQGSVAEREWQETELKCKTMLTVIS